MRFPVAHTFLKWFGPSMVAFCGAGIGLIAALSEPFPRVKNWAETQFDTWWPFMSAPWFLVTGAVIIAAYIWALVYTGQELKTGIAAMKPMSRKEKKADDALRERVKNAPPEEARGIIEAEIEKLNPPKNPSSPIFPAGKKAILDGYEGEAISFPYRKAVLQVKELKATAHARGGEKGLVKIGCHIDIENQTGKPLKECRVRLVSINGDKLDTDNFLRIGGLRGDDTETLFTTYHHSIKRINFMKRDLDDVVSNPPFLLCLNDRDLPLSDGKEYKFTFALESEYEHPTFVTVRCFIPERETIEISVENQSLDLSDEQA